MVHQNSKDIKVSLSTPYSDLLSLKSSTQDISENIILKSFCTARYFFIIQKTPI